MKDIKGKLWTLLLSLSPLYRVFILMSPRQTMSLGYYYYYYHQHHHHLKGKGGR